MIEPRNNPEKKTLSKKKEADFLTKMRKRHEESVKAERANYENGLEDLLFKTDQNQWPDKIRQQRDNDNKPVVTANFTRKFAERVVNDERMNSTQIKILPTHESFSLSAEAFGMLIKHVEQRSHADQARSTAFNGAVSNGFGYTEITTEFSSEDSADEQEIRISQIPDPFIIHCDPIAKEYDRRDARWYFKDLMMPKLVFEERYPKASPVDFESKRPEGYNWENWFTFDKQVRLVEYYYKEEAVRTIALFINNQTKERRTYDTSKEGFKEKALPILREQGFEQAKDKEGKPKQRDSKYWKVHHCIANGQEILEGPTLLPGKYIPIIPYLGRVEWINGKCFLYSLIRDGKDSQRMVNYWLSALTEQLMLQTKAPFLTTPNAIQGHEAMWNAANIESRNYLLWNDSSGEAGRPQRLNPPTAAAGYLEGFQLAKQTHMDVIGMGEAAMGQRSNERTGEAIKQRRMASDVVSYVFYDNKRRSVQFEAEIILDLAPHIYDTERLITIMGDDQALQSFQINVRDPITGEKFNDLSIGEYKVVCDIGPSFMTQKQEASQALAEFVQYAGPEMAPLLLPLIVKYSDSFPIGLAKELKETVEGHMKQKTIPPPPGPKEIGAQIRNHNGQLDAARKQTDLLERGVSIQQ